MSDPIMQKLDEMQARCDAATEGPWAPWLDLDGAPHMNGMLMVGNADAVIPDGEAWIEGVDVNPVAHTHTPEDRAFIAASRTDMPRLIAALKAVLAEHYPSGVEPACNCCSPACACGHWEYPCPTVKAIATALGVDDD